MPTLSRPVVAIFGLLFIGGGAAGIAAAHPHGDDGDDDAARHATHATFQVNGTHVLGKHVSFTVSNATGGVTDFASRGAFDDVVIFTSIRSSPHLTANTTWRAAGAQFRFVDPGFVWHAHDRGDAAWTLRAHENETVRLALAPGIEPTLLENGTLLRLTHDGHSAWLRVTGDDAEMMINGSAVTVKLPAGTTLHFRIAHHAGSDRHDRDSDKDDRKDARDQDRIEKLLERIQKIRDELRDRENGERDDH